MSRQLWAVFLDWDVVGPQAAKLTKLNSRRRHNISVFQLFQWLLQFGLVLVNFHLFANFVRSSLMFFRARVLAWVVRFERTSISLTWTRVLACQWVHRTLISLTRAQDLCQRLEFSEFALHLDETIIRHTSSKCALHK